MSHLTLIVSEPLDPKVARFGGPDSHWAPGRHGAEYILPGKTGGLDWGRLTAEYVDAECPEVLAAAVGAAETIRAARAPGRTRSQA